jgi:EAL domain-containing protein (putative c-di-GMP-specific phosphodiesterase class I)
VVDPQLSNLLGYLRFQEGATTAHYNGYELNTALQPIYSFAHQRPVGCEALIRARDEFGTAVPPPILFGKHRRVKDALFLDRLCRTLHLANFQALNAPIWLFLNVNPVVAVHGLNQGNSFRDLLSHFQVPLHQVVIEILENAIPSEQHLDRTVSHYRELGCLVAVDDFGAGHSNFERIWRIQPDIVKLDRKTLADAVTRPIIRRSLPNLVGLLHEAGCIVLAEGIETEDEAMIALDAGVDLAQGYLFARPFPINRPEKVNLEDIRRIQDAFKTKCIAESHQRQDKLSAYTKAFESASEQIRNGSAVEVAAEALFNLEGTLRFYVINEHGNQTSRNLYADGSRHGDPRLWPLSEARGASWYHRTYFRRAITHPDEIQTTGPYLSLPDAQMCLTLSMAMLVNDKLHVACLDIAA